ncbi:MAG: PAS domain S-box protein, partial [Verrucomicrobia bacterium]|nr:PAS domain S-box protein [Verrucomicrobiota bacterium]
ATYHFCHALTLTALYPTASAAQQAEYRLILDAKLKKLQLWADNCPENYSNRQALLLAELARIESRDLDAMRLYDEAIRSAHQNGFIQNEAIANEIAARFYAARGLQTIAQTYIKNARYCYLRWGAFSKVNEIDQDYSLPHEELTRSSVETIETTVEQLHLGTVIKVSEAVSGEIVLDKLVQTLMVTAIEYAGAERGLLILPYREVYRIAAEARTGRDEVEVKLQQHLVTPSDLPDSLLRYVIRTRQSVILDDALIENQFSNDKYVRAERPRSIFCLPLVKQAKLVGILYLENNLAPGVFTPTRITVLKLLASQAAISLENTRLYSELEEREAKIRRLVDANIVGIFIWDLGGEIIEANEAFLRMLGFAREDLIAGRLRWRDLVPPDWCDRVDQAIAELEATGVIHPFEMEYFRKEGGRVPVLAGSAFFEESRSEGVAFVLDLTERKRGEEALRRSEAYLAQAQRLSQTGSITWRVSSGKLTELIWSDEAFRIAGYDRTVNPSEELLLKRVHPEDIPLVQETFSRAAREGNLDFEHRLLMPDGSVKHVHVVLEAVGPDPANREFVGTVMDVTARKQAEEAARRAQAELAHVSRVTMVGELTASIAHEVNQPLAGMLVNANASLRWLTRDSPDLTEARAAIHRIVRDGNRAGEVISRVRALFKKAPAANEPVDINEVIQEVLALTRAEFQRNGVSLVTRFANGLPLIVGDKVQLQQVTLNLVVNAIEAMSGLNEGPRQLFVSSEHLAQIAAESDQDRAEDQDFTNPESTYVLIKFQDTGPGLNPADLKRVFETFYTTKSNGMGMGLAISRSIVEAHGGRLWARSNSPRGAIFQFVLPVVV